MALSKTKVPKGLSLLHKKCPKARGRSASLIVPLFSFFLNELIEDDKYTFTYDDLEEYNIETVICEKKGEKNVGQKNRDERSSSIINH